MRSAGNTRRLATITTLLALFLVPSMTTAVDPPPPLGPGAPCEGADWEAYALVRAGVSTFTDEPGAGEWRAWFTSPDALWLPAPPEIDSATTAAELAELHAFQATRTPEQVEAARFWGEGPAGRPWEEILLRFVEEQTRVDPKQNPPRISREIAILETAMYDTLVAVWRTKYCHVRPHPSTLDPALAPALPLGAAPTYPSEHAAVAGAASTVLQAFFPDPEGELEAMAREAAESRLWAGLNYRTDVEVGLEIGREVARRTLAARAGDGSSATWDGSGRITGRCNWAPTPPAFVVTPAEPVWGRVRPFLLANGSQFRPPPPPECDGDDYTAQVRDLYEMSRALSPRQRAIAESWAGGPGTKTPPGMNLQIALDQSERHDLSTMRHARVTAYVGTALADAAIAAWDAKYAYWGDRPVTAIRRTIDRDWSSHITTPPFPGYVSGHATFSGAASEVLAGIFPEDAVMLRALASEAALSRYYGGIHIRADNERGLDLGARIAGVALARASADGG